MDDLQHQVSRARRRLNIQRFLDLAPWTLAASLLVAAAAVLVPKLWPMDVDRDAWWAGWLSGSAVGGLLTAAVVTWMRRQRAFDAALEIDRRFGLKERVSSAWLLPPVERGTEIGRAVMADAQRRVAGVEVGDAFPMRTGWPLLVPLVPALLAVAIALLVPDAERAKVAASTSEGLAREQIKRSAQELSKKLADRAQQAEEAGLEDAESLLKQLREAAEELARRDDVDRQQALVRLNDLAKEIEKRREALGAPEQLQRQLQRMQELEKGPGDRVAAALQQGDPEKALQELQRLMKDLQSGGLSDEQKQQLAKQLESIRRQMQETVDAHRRAKEELERQIQQKLAEGDREAAGKLQRQLDELEAQNQTMQRLQELAERFADASESLQQGDADKAASELSQLAEQLQEMQSDLDKLEQLDELMNEIASSKNAINCEQCDGGGCAECQGRPGALAMEGDRPGQGLGDGAGYGERPESPTETGTYEARLRAKPQAGEAVRIGDARGPNKPGLSQQEAREIIAGSLNEESDPLTEQRLPRTQKDHVRQYYELRGQGTP